MDPVLAFYRDLLKGHLVKSPVVFLMSKASADLSNAKTRSLVTQ
jgi:hypothetical protein